MVVFDNLRKMVPITLGLLSRIISSFVLSKYIAVVYGPPGIALFGQFINLSGILTNVSTGATDNGIVRNFAASRSEPHRLRQAVSISFQMVMAFSILVALFVIAEARFVSKEVFFSTDYEWIVIMLSLSILVVGPLAWLMAGLNGLGHLTALGFIAFMISLGIIGGTFAANRFGEHSLQWVLFFQCLAQVPALGVACVFAWRWFPRPSFLWKKHGPLAEYISYFRFSLMTLATVVCVPAATMLIRRIIVEHSGVEVAGIYEALNTVSDGYLGLPTIVVSTFYLPRLSAAEEHVAQAAEVREMLALVFPLALLGGLMVFAGRDFIFRILFSRQFLIAPGLLAIQIGGDALRMTTRAAGYQLIARGWAKRFIFMEAITAVVRVSLTEMFTRHWGLSGAVMAYLFSYICCAIGMIWLFRRLIPSMREVQMGSFVGKR
jgi:O-antigen/teichoic acid export membrane protein